MNKERTAAPDQIDLSLFSTDALIGIAQDPTQLTYYAAKFRETEVSLRFRIFQRIGTSRTMPFPESE